MIRFIINRGFKARELLALAVLIAVFLSLASALGGCSPWSSESSGSSPWQRVYRAASSAVVLISTEYQYDSATGRSESFGLGSGFLVDGGIVLTARHILYPWEYRQQLVARKLVTGQGADESSAQRRAWPLGSRIEKETALNLVPSACGAKLKMRSVVTEVDGSLVMHGIPEIGPWEAVAATVDRLPGTALRIAASPPEPLEEVLVLGFPFSRLTEGVVVPNPSLGRVRLVADSMLELDASTHPGISGGTVLNAAGEVVGLMIAQYNSDAYGLAVNAETLRGIIACVDAERRG